VNKDRRVKRDQKTGTWYFVADVPSPDGRRRQARRRGFATSKAANDALHDLLEASRAGLPTGVRGGLLVGDYLTSRWLPSLAGQELRPTTVDSYRRITANHLVPRLGAVRLSALDASMIEVMLAGLAADGLSPKTRKNVLGVLSKALTDAVRWRLIGVNPAVGAQAPRSARPVPKAWSASQLGVFLNVVSGDRLEALWRFVTVTGCRRGEAAGLRWDDLDLDRGLVTITNQRTLAAGRVVEGPVKTSSGARTVALDPDTVTVLRAWRRAQRAELVRLGVRPAVAYVFTGESGLPLWPQWITSRFRDLCDEAGLPRIGPHGLRHSAATWLIASGASPKLVSQRIGHASPTVTLSLYSHVLPGHDEAAAGAFAAALADAVTAQSGRDRDHDVTTHAT
jgi:integrase